MAKCSLPSLILLAFALVQSNATQNHPSPPSAAPAPQLSTPQLSPSCDVLLFKMIDCLPYLTKISKMAKPVESCCSGFLEVWKLDLNCVCDALNGSVELGFQLNMTRVFHVSSVCGSPHVSLDKCLPIPSVAKPPVQIIKPSPAMTSAQAMTTSDADSSSQSNFFKIVISLVVILNFLALNLPI
ncbi:non-specific lipid transfer protein GPI-anchored 23 [Lactuca sativa]|uniref:non-specific lipid transfer protein GPI-anchored 23 n=1 Tax=Lactuca sativa TaxID=4236 RepID=UPI000CC3FCFB|nr:non-specific lipid transfer protein GPI-anchored 23 [Lactuca sativa]